MSDPNTQAVLSDRVTGAGSATYIARQDMDLRWLHAHLESTATAGNRRLILSLYDTDGTTVLFDLRANATQGASSHSHYPFIKGVSRESSFTGGNELLMSLPDIRINANQKIVITDENAVDAADTFEFGFQADI